MRATEYLGDLADYRAPVFIGITNETFKPLIEAGKFAAQSNNEQWDW